MFDRKNTSTAILFSGKEPSFYFNVVRSKSAGAFWFCRLK